MRVDHTPLTEHMPQRESRLANALSALQREWPLLVNLPTTVLFLAFSTTWFADLSDPAWFAFLLLFTVDTDNFFHTSTYSCDNRLASAFTTPSFSSFPNWIRWLSWGIAIALLLATGERQTWTLFLPSESAEFCKCLQPCCSHTEQFSLYKQMVSLASSHHSSPHCLLHAVSSPR